MKWLLWILGLFAALIGVIAIVGACLPRAHRASRAASDRQNSLALYGAMRDFAGAAQWQSGVKRSELLPSADGQVRFRTTTSQGAVDYAVLEDQPGVRLAVKIADDSLPYGGTWTYELTPTSDGTAVRITEDGEVKNAIFRFVARFVMGYTASMDAYLRDLGKKFGETVEIRD